MRRHTIFTLLAAALGVAATGLLGEVMLTWLEPTPRIQIIRPTQSTWRRSLVGRPANPDERDRVMTVVDGVPLWTFPAHEARYARDCIETHPDAQRVVVLGSSIFAGVSIPSSEVFTRKLMEILGKDEPVCIMNLAEAGYSFQNQRMVALRALPELEPDLVIWEMWGNSAWPFTMVGDTAYRFRELILSADGTPNPLGLWSPLHRYLLPRSRLYELSVLTLAPTLSDYDKRQRQVRYARAVMTDTLKWVRDDLETEVMTVFCPNLHTPFAEQVRQREVLGDARYDALEHVVDKLEVPKLFLDVLFSDAGLRHEDIRLDPCCHYNIQGQEALAAILAPHVAKHLAETRGEPTSASAP